MKYKLEQLNCPACGAGIDMDLQGRKAVFCPFCGNQFAVDDGERVYTKNINIRKDIKIHERYTNDAALEKERRKDKESEREHKEFKLTIAAAVIILLASYGNLNADTRKREQEERERREAEQVAIDAGMVRPGQNDQDMVGKNYQVVMEQLKSAGFSDITLIDMDDAGLLKNKKDTVESVTIGGKASFRASDFFEPDAKIVISYH
ncbi:MAG: hypothetical protein J6O73_07590 [Lachnospiraceae bacterium]|nr:hypothetical protein [Lachnospiraceae bacterium]